MRPEYYADQYRRYQTYVKNFSGNRIFKIACGPNGANYDWTEVLMRDLAGGGRRPMMQGLPPHYYCGTGRRSRSATEFTEIRSHNTFEKPTVVEPAGFTDAKVTKTGFTARLPAKSVVVLEVE